MDFIVDIDGTVADNSARSQWVNYKPKNWKAYNSTMANDLPIDPVIEVVRSLHKNINNNIIFCSGREETYRDITTEWLNTYVFYPKNLYMRSLKDYRDDGIVKYELLLKIREDGFNPVAAFDDRQRVCRMWIENGIHLFDVSQGNGEF